MFGFTENGFIRKRFVDFIAEYITKLEAAEDSEGNKVFPGTITLNNIDKYSGTPLVELATLMAGSQHEIHESAEDLSQNLDPRDATGKYLSAIGVTSGVIPLPGEREESYRSRVLDPAANNIRASSGGIGPVVGQVTNAICSRFSVSTIDNPIDGLPAPSGSISVLGDVDPNAVAQAIWNRSEAGTLTLFGCDYGTAIDLEGVCHNIKYNQGSRIFIAADLQITLDPCCEYTIDELPTIIAERFKEVHKCSQKIYQSDITKLICDLCVNVHSVNLARRGREWMATDENGEFCDASQVLIDDSTEFIDWASDGCTHRAEIWCDPSDCTIELQYFEFADMSPTFVNIEVVEPIVC